MQGKKNEDNLRYPVKKNNMLQTCWLDLVRFPKFSQKNGEMGKLGQDRLEVRWEAAMFLFNLVI